MWTAAGRRVALEPQRELLLGDLARRQTPEGENSILFRRGHFETVQLQKRMGHSEYRPFITIHKGMVGSRYVG
jgi:hypothetical protein